MHMDKNTCNTCTHVHVQCGQICIIRQRCISEVNDVDKTSPTCTYTNITPPHHTDFLLCQACAILQVVQISGGHQHTSTKRAHYKFNLKWGHSDKQDTLGCPQPMFVNNKPLKSGHLTSQDTFFCSKDVQIREVRLLHIHIYMHVHVHVLWPAVPHYSEYTWHCTCTREPQRVLFPAVYLSQQVRRDDIITPTAQLIRHAQEWPYKVTSLLDQGRHSCIIKPWA